MSSPRRNHTNTRDAVLIAHANDMIARTSLSQRDFATALSKAIHSLIPDLQEDRKVPDFESMDRVDGDAYLKMADAWLKRVQRWLDESVDIPAWLEEPWVTALLPEWRERCLIELAGRYGLLAVRPVGIEGMDAMQVFSALMHRVGDVAGLGSKVFDDLVITEKDGEWLPELAASLDAMAAKCTTLSRTVRLELSREKQGA